MRTKPKRINRSPTQWKDEIWWLKDGLTIAQAAKEMGVSYIYASIKLKHHGYKIKDT